MIEGSHMVEVASMMMFAAIVTHLKNQIYRISPYPCIIRGAFL